MKRDVPKSLWLVEQVSGWITVSDEDAAKTLTDRGLCAIEFKPSGVILNEDESTPLHD